MTKPRAFQLACFFLLLPWAAIVFLAMRSFFIADQIEANTSVRQTSAGYSEKYLLAVSSWGTFYLDFSALRSPTAAAISNWVSPPGLIWRTSRLPLDVSATNHLGFRFTYSLVPFINHPTTGFPNSNAVRELQIVVPFWALILITGLPLLPGLGIHRRLIKRYRLAHNLCPTCTYNLTGNLSGTCPECGSAIPSPQSKIENQNSKN